MELELRWQVVMEFKVVEALANMTNELADHVGEGSLLQKPGLEPPQEKPKTSTRPHFNSPKLRVRSRTPREGFLELYELAPNHAQSHKERRN